MTKQTDFTKIFGQMPNMMDNKALEDGFKRMADINEQMTGVAADAAAKNDQPFNLSDSCCSLSSFR